MSISLGICIGFLNGRIILKGKYNIGLYLVWISGFILLKPTHVIDHDFYADQDEDTPSKHLHSSPECFPQLFS